MSNLLETIKDIFWSQSMIEVDQDTYVQFRNHSIHALAASAMSRFVISEELKNKWSQSILKQISYNAHCVFLEKRLPITVPYVVLKGTSASQYYPHPEYRALGDIDIITKREDFDKAYQELQDDGYVVVKELEREVGLVKNNVMIELHRYFASLNNPEQAKYLDDLIIQNINDSHVLPDEINGIVLLEHIDQHLENGLGMRQIIDWMMFVDKCLPDNKWQTFKVHAGRIGLETLAVVTTKMCEMYLGLPQREWCSKADERLCKQLMDYICACGNFGVSRSENISTGDNVFYLSKTVKSFFSLLQERGLENWQAAHDHMLLKPFAWIYQMFRYMKKGLKREDAHMNIKKEYVSAKERDKLFKKLGVRQASRGLVVYRNGEYKKVR